MNELIRSTIEKEILIAEKYYENLDNLSGWRLPQVYIQAGNCRKSIIKCNHLLGITGKWYIDIFTYINSGLPWFLPTLVLVLPAISIISAYQIVREFIIGILSKNIYGEKYHIVKNYKHNLFMEDTVARVFTIKIPTVKAELPNEMLVSSIIGTAIVLAILLFSYSLKRIFLLELKFRKNALKKEMLK